MLETAERPVGLGLLARQHERASKPWRPASCAACSTTTPDPARQLQVLGQESDSQGAATVRRDAGPKVRRADARRVRRRSGRRRRPCAAHPGRWAAAALLRLPPRGRSRRRRARRGAGGMGPARGHPVRGRRTAPLAVDDRLYAPVRRRAPTRRARCLSATRPTSRALPDRRQARIRPAALRPRPARRASCPTRWPAPTSASTFATDCATASSTARSSTSPPASC